MELSSEIVREIISLILPLVLSALGAFVLRLLVKAGQSITQWSEGKAHAATWQCALTKIVDVTTSAVEEVEQTLVRDLKQAKRWDATTAKQARDTAVNIAKRHLGALGMVELQSCLGHEDEATIDGMLRTHVERHVFSMGARNSKSPIVPLGNRPTAAEISEDTLDGPPLES